MKKGKLERKRDKLYFDRFRGLDQDGVKRLLDLDAVLESHGVDMIASGATEKVRMRFEESKIPFTRERVLYYGLKSEAEGRCANEWYVIVRDCFGDPRPLRKFLLNHRSADQLKRYFPDCTQAEIRQIGYRQLNSEEGQRNEVLLERALEAFVECNDRKAIREIRRRAVVLGKFELAERTASVMGTPLSRHEAKCIGRKILEWPYGEGSIEFLKRHGLRKIQERFLCSWKVDIMVGLEAHEQVAKEFGRVLTNKQLLHILRDDRDPHSHADERVRATEMLATRSPKKWSGEVMTAVRFARDVWLMRDNVKRADSYATRCGVPITIEELRAVLDRHGNDDRYSESNAFAREMLAKLVSEKLDCPPPPAPKSNKVRHLKAVA